MSAPKKLQVFVSSTFTDLRDERQAAVEAILSAGHIPAGMELFAAGDEAQMIVIQRWIDESDVFMLILGSRYGSIEATTGKSYVQLEYEYAVEKAKPLFAVVSGTTSVAGDQDHDDERLLRFRATVQQRMVRFWSDPRDIKLAVHETLAEFSRRPAMLGWVRSENGANLAYISEEVARLSRENATLRERLAESSPRLFNGLTFEELFRILSASRVVITPQDRMEMSGLTEIASFFGHEKVAPLHLFWRLSSQLPTGASVTPAQQPFARALHEAGLIELSDPSYSSTLYRFTDVGRQFLLCLRNSRDMSAAEDFRA